MYIVIENTPGYPPEDDEPGEFEEYQDAVSYANELADELEEDGRFVCDRSWASRDNYYAINCVETDGIARLGRVITVERAEE